MNLKEELFILSHGFSSEWQECVEGEITPVVTARKQREQGREQDTSLQDGSPETSFLQVGITNLCHYNLWTHEGFNSVMR